MFVSKSDVCILGPVIFLLSMVLNCPELGLSIQEHIYKKDTFLFVISPTHSSLGLNGSTSKSEGFLEAYITWLVTAKIENFFLTQGDLL